MNSPASVPSPLSVQQPLPVGDTTTRPTSKLETIGRTYGTGWMLVAFGLANLIIMLEVADRVSLKNGLEVAREINSSRFQSAAG